VGMEVFLFLNLMTVIRHCDQIASLNWICPPVSESSIDLGANDAIYSLRTKPESFSVELWRDHLASPQQRNGP
jgi:hypothetical protein